LQKGKDLDYIGQVGSPNTGKLYVLLGLIVLIVISEFIKIIVIYALLYLDKGSIGGNINYLSKFATIRGGGVSCRIKLNSTKVQKKREPLIAPKQYCFDMIYAEYYTEYNSSRSPM
jgi:hypothetical protein